jgi:predicted component of type VI protein secretion system
MDGSRLVMSQGPQPGKTFVLDRDTLTVGRDPGNDIVIAEPQVSRQHSRITRQGNFLILEDLGSTNGTFVNGVRLTAPHTLSNGDVMGMGDAVILTFYGTGTGATDTLVGPQSAAPSAQHMPQPSAQPAITPPPTPAAQPSFSQPSMMYAETVAPQQPPPNTPIAESRPRRMWLAVGCAVLVLLALMACVGVFILDYLAILPPIFYEPLRWMGLI